MISSLNNNTVANLNVTTSQSLVDYSNEKGSALMICKTIWDDMCVTGVHVIKRAVNENTEWTYGDRGGFTVGNIWTIVTWAVEGACPSKTDPMLAHTKLDLYKHNRYQLSSDGATNEDFFLALN